MNLTAWASGQCRACRRVNAQRADALGIPGGVPLAAGRCPECGVTPPPPSECHVCGGFAERGSFWRLLSGDDIPDSPAALSWVDALLNACEVDSRESFVSRGELDAIMRFLYEDRERSYMRKLIRSLISERLTGGALGERLAREEEAEKRREGVHGR